MAAGFPPSRAGGRQGGTGNCKAERDGGLSD